jgi:hypothetical protein
MTASAPHVDDWLRLHDAYENAVVVSVDGGSSRTPPDELWTTLERALEIAESRLVVADIRDVGDTDDELWGVLHRVARSAIRWGVPFCLVLRPDAGTGDELIPSFRTLAEAISASGSELPT